MRSAVIQLRLSNYNPGGAAVCSCSVNLENAHNHKKKQAARTKKECVRAANNPTEHNGFDAG